MKPDRALDGVPEMLWTMVVLAPHRLLMLDYDGTLAPFRVERDEARPLPAALAPLRRLAASGRTRLAVVSGRPAREVERLLGPLGATLVGEHGWEQLEPGGALEQRELGEAVAAALDEAERVSRSAGWQALLERKRSALVLHTRALPAAEAAATAGRVADAWERLVLPGRMTIDRVDGGLELRARRLDKGTVARALLEASPPGTLGVFVGDDVTDEDAFEAVRDRGFGVRVGGAGAPTRAMANLPGLGDVPAFLERWLERTEPGGAATARAPGGARRAPDRGSPR